MLKWLRDRFDCLILGHNWQVIQHRAVDKIRYRCFQCGYKTPWGWNYHVK